MSFNIQEYENWCAIASDAELEAARRTYTKQVAVGAAGASTSLAARALSIFTLGLSLVWTAAGLAIAAHARAKLDAIQRELKKRETLRLIRSDNIGQGFGHRLYPIYGDVAAVDSRAPCHRSVADGIASAAEGSTWSVGEHVDSAEVKLAGVKSLASGLGTRDVEVDMSAILDPAKYMSQLEDLESVVLRECHVSSLLHSSPGDGNHIAALKPTSTRDMDLYFRGLVSAIDNMRIRGYCARSIVVLVQDNFRKHVLQAKSIPLGDIDQLYRLACRPSLDSLGLQATIRKFCVIFGLFPDSGTTIINELQEPQSTLMEYLGLLCSLLRLAVTIYIGSHCSDLTWQLPLIQRIMYTGPRGRKLYLKRRRLACLDKFIGGPVWVFESGDGDNPTNLSTTADQLADLWGPLYVVPSSKGIEYPLAIQTEGGIIYRSDRTIDVDRIPGEEITCHWVSASPARLALKTHGDNSNSIVIPLRSDELLPQVLQPFPPNSRLLIGHPFSSQTLSTTVVRNGNCDSSPHLDLVTNKAFEFDHNPHCCLELEDFGKQYAFDIHSAGVRKAYNVSNEYQAGFSIGQYVNVGLQKTWKKRPAITHKDRIMSFCSGSLATPVRVKQVLRLRIGLEVSACTFNARRVCLEEVIKVAFREDRKTIDSACTAGEASTIAAYLGELEATGLSRDNQGLLFWPLSNGIGEVFQLKDPPEWLNLLEDTPESSCFAVLSPRCLQYAGYDSRRLLGRMCSSSSTSLINTVFHTSIEINPESLLRPPLNPETNVKLPNGQLCIRDGNGTTHMAFYQQPVARRIWNKPEQNKTNVHHELQVANRPSCYTFDVCILDDPR